MNPMPKHKDAIARMRAANPISTAELRASLGEGELREARDASIAAGESAIRPRPRRRVPRRPLAACAGLTCVAAVALVVLLVGTPGGGNQPDFAAAALAVAEANPRLLVSEPGWSVIGVEEEEFEPDEGLITFSDESHELGWNAHEIEIIWAPAREYDSDLRERAELGVLETSTLLGATATTVHEEGSEYATILSPMGSVFLEVSGAVGSYADYETLLQSLRPVDVNTWLEAMPPGVVRPKERPLAIERMLKGVPLPPGFDLAALQGKELVSEPVDLAIDLGDAVSCGWVESWLSAKRAGDEGRAQKAVDAMATVRDWPLMKVVESESGWAGNILGAAQELKRGHLNNGPVGTLGGGDGYEIEMGPVWAMNIECESHFWRRPVGSG
jgi:hypothetical protein